MYSKSMPIMGIGVNGLGQQELAVMRTQTEASENKIKHKWLH